MTLILDADILDLYGKFGLWFKSCMFLHQLDMDWI